MAKGAPSLTPEQVRKVSAAMQVLYERCSRNQSALARQLGMTQAAVNDLMSGKNKPSLRTATRVAEQIGTNVWSLLGEGSEVTRETHPTLFSAVEMVGPHVPAEVRERVLAAAAGLPDLAQGTWIAILLDPAHGAGATHGTGAPSSRASPASHTVRTAKTMEIPVTPKKKS